MRKKCLKQTKIMFRNIKLTLLFLLVLVFIGCSGKTDNENTDGPMVEASVTHEQTNSNEKRVGEKLIKDGYISFKTNNVEKTYNWIKSKVILYKGYISDEKIENYEDSKGYDLIIRLPSKDFDNFLNKIIEDENIKEIESKTIMVKDVTEEYIDIESRLKVKKEYEIKLLDLLSKAKNVNETTEIYKQLNELRIEIEATQGRLKYLNDQVNYSTLNISFRKDYKYSNRFFSELWEALNQGLQVFLKVFTTLTYLWVIILVVFLSRWVYKRYKKNRRKE